MLSPATTSLLGPNVGQACLLGSPLEHSLSPAIHNAAYRELGLPWQYTTHSLASGTLGQVLQELQNSGVVGCNLTMPLKEEAWHLLQPHLSANAKLARSVNTLAFRNRVCYGYSTDGPGWLAAWNQSIGQDLRNRDIVVLGAGGAAKAIIATLSQCGVKRIYVHNRSSQRIEQLMSHWAGAPDLIEAGLPELGEGMVIIQTTPLGMANYPELNLFSWPAKVPANLVACDLIYQPRPTAFLRQAQQLGIPTMDGLGMLIHQAALAIAIWSGKQPNLAVMRQACQD